MKKHNYTWWAKYVKTGKVATFAGDICIVASNERRPSDNVNIEWMSFHLPFDTPEDAERDAEKHFGRQVRVVLA